MQVPELLYGPAQDLVETALETDPVRPKTLSCDSFIARSAMQKAIRRGQREIALSAAATVLLTDSAIVWRRLLVTALEDLGIHQVGLLIRIAAAIERRRFGHRLRDEWPLVARVVEDCSRANRCQAANDLHNLSLNAREYDRFRSISADLSAHDLLAIVGESGRDLVERNIAVLSCLGADHAPWTPHKQRVASEAIIAAAGCNVQPAVRTIYGWAFRKSRLPLATASLLLVSVEGGIAATPDAFDDDVPELTWVGGVPGYALDQYTRAGRRAIGDYVATSEAWRAFVSKLNLTKAEERAAAGELIFRIEGAAVTRRSSWDVARVLSGLSRTVGCYVPQKAVEEGLCLIRSELPLLDRLRARDFRGSL